MKNANKKKGFTLVELAIVIAVIAILAAILVPTLTTVLKKANKTKDDTTVNKIIQKYVTDNAEDTEIADAWASETPYYVVYNGNVFKVVNTSSTKLEKVKEGESVGEGKYSVTATSDYTIEASGKTYIAPETQNKTNVILDGTAVVITKLVEKA